MTVDLGGSSRRRTRTHAIKYAQLHPDPVAVRDAFVGIRTEPDLLEVLDRWYGTGAAVPHRHTVR